MATATKSETRQRGATAAQLAHRKAHSLSVAQIVLGSSVPSETRAAQDTLLDALIAETDLLVAQDKAERDYARLAHFLGVAS